MGTHHDVRGARVFCSACHDICTYSYVHAHSGCIVSHLIFQYNCSDQLAERVYGLLLVQSLLLQVVVTSFVPYVGMPVAFLYSCWLYSFLATQYAVAHTPFFFYTFFGFLFVPFACFHLLSFSCWRYSFLASLSTFFLRFQFSVRSYRAPCTFLLIMRKAFVTLSWTNDRG